MKKVIMFAVAVMFSVAAFAQVKVSQGGVVTTYEKGATVNIDSSEVTEVSYGNVSISIPKGKKVVISQNRVGNIVISGYNLSGVKIMGKEVHADDAAVYVVDPVTQTVVKTSLAENAAQPAQQTTNNNQQSANKQQNKNTTTQKPSTQEQKSVAEESFPEMNDYVDDVISQQAVDNVEEQLSPSSPR